MALICREADVRDHWNDVLGSFCDILPGGRRSHALDVKEYGHALLRQSGVTPETTVRYDGRRIPVVPFLDVAASEQQRYWLSWHEGWRTPDVGRGGKSLQFTSSSLVIYTGEAGANKLQVLRAEWAGSKVHMEGRTSVDTFQGQGAAHPHWHLDGISNKEIGGEAATGAQVETRSVTGLAELAHELAEDEPESAAEDVGSSVDIRSLAHIDSAWTSIHLATSARWAQSEWPGPGGPHDSHAANPANCAEIASWLISCVRYLQSELQGQMRRARR